MGDRLTKAQRALLERMGDTLNALRNFDEVSPMWWIEGDDFRVHPRTAERVVHRDLATLTGHWGGQPGVLGFTRSAAGRLALTKEAERG